jgi:hypothetical protein
MPPTIDSSPDQEFSRLDQLETYSRSAALTISTAARNGDFFFAVLGSPFPSSAQGRARGRFSGVKGAGTGRLPPVDPIG